jgi:hypothetical protein
MKRCYKEAHLSSKIAKNTRRPSLRTKMYICIINRKFTFKSYIMASAFNDAHTKRPITKRPKLKTAHHETAPAQKDPISKRPKAQNDPSSKRPKLKTIQGTKRPTTQNDP